MKILVHGAQGILVKDHSTAHFIRVLARYSVFKSVLTIAHTAIAQIFIANIYQKGYDELD